MRCPSHPPQSSTPQPARLATSHAPLTTLCRSTMHMATIPPLITRLTCPRPPRPSCPSSSPLILTPHIQIDINTLLTETSSYHHSIRHHHIALFRSLPCSSRWRHGDSLLRGANMVCTMVHIMGPEVTCSALCFEYVKVVMSGECLMHFPCHACLI